MRKQRKAEEAAEKVEAAKQWRDKKLDKGRKVAQVRPWRAREARGHRVVVLVLEPEPLRVGLIDLSARSECGVNRGCKTRHFHQP